MSQHANPGTNGSSTPPDQTKPSADDLGKKSFFDRFKKKDSDKEKGSSEKSADASKLPPVKFTQLFRYANRTEKTYILISCIAAIIHGAIQPMFTILFGGIIDEFQVVTVEEADLAAFSNITSDVGDVAKWFLLLGAVAFVTSAIQVRFQLIAAQRICARLRRMYFESLLSQDFTWYGQEDGGELTARVAGDVNLIQGGIGDKVTSAVQFISMFVVGFIVAFVYGPLLTLVMLSILPLMMAGGAVFAKLAAESTGEGTGAYGGAGAIASEVIGLIRVVTAYNGQETEAKRYEEELRKAYKADVKKGFVTGLGIGFTMFVIFCGYAIAFTFGANRVRSGSITAGDILITFFSVFIASFSIGQAAPSFKAFAEAQGAAPRVYEVIGRESEINPLDEDEGDVIEDFKGNVSFKSVNFDYKHRVADDLESGDERRLVLENFNLDIPSGTSHALVGSSGCGKSTTVRLIERFYDVIEGAVTFDGVDVRQLNVKWLRSQIGYVGQMPTLFARTIRENIALGAAMEAAVDEKTGKKVLRRMEVSDAEIIEAAKKANAHDFIMKLPEQYDTLLGERGALLSGGQKQRVCIARALIRNPKILILDEATAALDAQSERIVQSALEKAAAGRTTITIAHRLSTVKDADVISVIDKGTVVEYGTHSQLLGMQGAYHTLIEHQRVEAQKAKEAKEGSATTGEIPSAGLAKVASTSLSHSVQVDGGAIEGEESEEAAVDKGIISRAFKTNRNEWLYIFLGMFGAALNGAAFPAMAIIFSEVIEEILSSNEKGEVSKWAVLYVAIGGASFLGNFLQHAMLGISGERMTYKLRRASFRALLKQDMGFFDMKQNSLGALSTRLATEATQVKGITGDVLGSFAFGLSTVLTGFLIAYIACWRVALVVTVVFPLGAVAQMVQLKMMTGFDADSETRYAAAGTVASEAVDNFETVTSIGVQDVFLNKYSEEVDKTIGNGRRTALIAGVAFGVSEFLAQVLWAVSFWVGSIFVRDGFCGFADLMKAVTGLLFGGLMLGNLSSTMPDWGKSKIAATRIFRLLDRESLIDPTLDVDFKKKINGDVSLEKAYFEYPTRPNIAVLRGMSVEVKSGQTLALVGASGSGKSTVVSLVERFYDVRSGSLKIDGTNIVEYDVKWVRKHVGLVAQEPDLFNRSVRDNIAYGLDHVEGTPVTDEMIVEAAKAANAHSFITELEDGTAPTGGDRTCHRARAEDSGAGRGDVGTGRGFRARCSGGAGSGGEGAHDDCRGAPAVDGEGRGRNCSGGARQDLGDRTARGAAANRERGVREPGEEPTEWRRGDDGVSGGGGNLGLQERTAVSRVRGGSVDVRRNLDYLYLAERGTRAWRRHGRARRGVRGAVPFRSPAHVPPGRRQL
ncbi:ABC transporter [Gracilaria domingensis]|nr:ABC transporter [Gracilaria domingensis]